MARKWWLEKRKERSAVAFTLIELLVVVAIIAILISILLPSLSSARNQAKAVKCAAALKDVGIGIASHLAENRGQYPTSYAYPHDANGDIDYANQKGPPPPFGYAHWSWYLYSKGKVGDGAFQCPAFPHNGAPRTNPGKQGANWEGGQVDDNGNGGPGGATTEDRQAPRMAFTANAAIIPRNKFPGSAAAAGLLRTNQFVRDNQIHNPGATILVTEFNNNWRAIGQDKGNVILAKSHRPLNPFMSLATGSDEFMAPPATKTFVYGTGSESGDERNWTWGLMTWDEIQKKSDLIDGQGGGYSELNAVGRHHPGGDGTWGGTTNFLYCDGHVSRKMLRDTLRDREWGDRYYGISGFNEVLNARFRGW